MSFKFYNPNPCHRNTNDCTVRGISLLTGKSWHDTYLGIVMVGYELCGMPETNFVWMEYLKRNGFKRYIIEDTCPYCYRVKDFCIDHPNGKYLLATGNHVVAVYDGDYYDIWDSGNEVPVFYFRKEI